MPWRIIQPAQIYPKPIKPIIYRNLAAGIFFGLFGGIFLVYLREIFNNVFHDIEELKNALKIPILGNIPFVSLSTDKDKELPITLEDIRNEIFVDKETGENKRFFFQESLRGLATSLGFLNADKPIQAIAITSSLRAEGKSFSTVFLCKTLSELGKKVILIDGDLRLPSLHKRINVSNIIGFANLLSDPKGTLDDVIQKFQILRIGILYQVEEFPDPVRLLSSKDSLHY